jgi:hypothetical protein
MSVDPDPDPDPEGGKRPTKVEKIKKFQVLKCWMFPFEGWRLFFAVHVFNFWSSKPWIRIRILSVFSLNQMNSETLVATQLFHASLNIHDWDENFCDCDE